MATVSLSVVPFMTQLQGSLRSNGRSGSRRVCVEEHNPRHGRTTEDGGDDDRAFGTLTTGFDPVVSASTTRADSWNCDFHSERGGCSTGGGRRPLRDLPAADELDEPFLVGGAQRREQLTRTSRLATVA
jgi:hypothetical protein